VAAGHSYGANTTLLASGRAGAARRPHGVDLHDERIRAAIVISAPPFYGESTLDSILGPVRVPSLHVTATEDVIRIPGYWSAAPKTAWRCSTPWAARARRWRCSKAARTACSPTAGTGGADRRRASC
jgi:pimeloyl-ACP methyl ester carboxylesterase